jgi:hypothetical protein
VTKRKFESHMIMVCSAATLLSTTSETYPMQDVALLEDEDEQSTDSDMSRPRDKPSWDSLLTNSDSNDLESSATDGEDEDSAALRPFDEVSFAISYACELMFETLKVTSVVTNKQQVASKSESHGCNHVPADKMNAIVELAQQYMKATTCAG